MISLNFRILACGIGPGMILPATAVAQARLAGKGLPSDLL